MAGDWYPKRVWFTKQREVVLVATLTGRSPQEVAGFLDDLWSFATENTADGFIPGVDLRGLLSAAGADETLWRAVEHAGWLCFRDGGIEIPNWQNWLSQSTKKRLKEQIRKRLGRAAARGQTSKKNGRLSKKSAPEKREEKREESKRELHPASAGCSSPGGGEPRRRDEVWDAVCAAFGLDPKTPSERARVGRIVRDLKLKGATPAEIGLRLGRYRRAWPNAADTPEALLKHWDHFAQERSPDARPDKPVGPPHRLGAPPGKYEGVGLRAGGLPFPEPARDPGAEVPPEQAP